MQVSVETTSGLERRITVGVPAEQVDKEVVKRLQDAAKKVRINGFRVGKVPFKVVKQRFGEGVRQEVLGEVINRTYFEALQKEDINPAGMPSIDTTKNVEGEDLEYVATIEVYPEIEVPDVSGFAINKPVAQVEDSDVDTMVENLRKQQATWEAVDRPAQQDDQVLIDYVGTKDGEEFDGGKAENQSLVLGSNSMIPGFEDGLVGTKAGEEKVLNLTFPEDYHAEELKGAAVEFKVKVNKVLEQKLPELDDEFFKKYGVDEGGLETFKTEVRSNMERELKNAEKSVIKTQALDALYEAKEVDLPKALVANEIDSMRKQMLQQFGDAAKNIDAASLLPDTMFEEQARKRVALGLLVGEIIKAEEIKPEEAKVQEAIEQVAATYHEPEAVVQYYTNNREARANIEAMVLEDAVVDHIVAKAKVTEEQTNYEDLMQRLRSEQ
ncbi:trigger factor [Gilvimarinus sp. F26214L]|uniref:trigger factor n=1 Tax=Gilvimarinus sp. DZF01 TaxID=3461371 RepID=UPI00404618F4